MTQTTELKGKWLKLAPIREAGHPAGISAPCWITCFCGARVPAYQGDQTCSCGYKFSSNGWVLKEPTDLIQASADALNVLARMKEKDNA